MRAKEIMTKLTLWCEPGEDTHTVAQLMRDRNVGFLPVLEDADSRRILGVLTDRDLALKVMAAGLDPRFTKVRESMTVAPVCCHEKDTVERVLARMTENSLRRIPIVGGEQRLLGVVSIEDIVRSGAVPATRLCDALKKIFRTAAQRHTAIA